MNGTSRNTGAEGVLEILRCGLERYAERRTAIHLGDRSGMSDIAKMLDYPRAALADRLHTHQRKNTERNIKHQLLLQRGHWFETGGHQALMGMASPLCHNWKSRSDTGMYLVQDTGGSPPPQDIP